MGNSRNTQRKEVAQKAATYVMLRMQHMAVAQQVPQLKDPKLGLVLGTGWGEVLTARLKNWTRFALKDIPGFEYLSELQQIEGHERNLLLGELGDVSVAILQGRIHLNEEPCSQEIYKMVRLQIELLHELGVQTLVATSAVGVLPPSRAKREAGAPRLQVGDIGVVKSLILSYAPPLPIWGGEFNSPNSALCPDLQMMAMQLCLQSSLRPLYVNHVMLGGPSFEGSRDKDLLAESDADIVGMSSLPEAAICAVLGVKMLGLCFVTNGWAAEDHSHEVNQARTREKSALLGQLLLGVVDRIAQQVATPATP